MMATAEKRFTANEKLDEALELLSEHFDLQHLPAYPERPVSGKQTARIAFKKTQRTLGQWGSRASIAQYFYYLGDYVLTKEVPKRRVPLDLDAAASDQRDARWRLLLWSAAIASIAVSILLFVSWASIAYGRHITMSNPQQIIDVALDSGEPVEIAEYDLALLAQMAHDVRGQTLIDGYILHQEHKRAVKEQSRAKQAEYAKQINDMLDERSRQHEAGNEEP